LRRKIDAARMNPRSTTSRDTATPISRPVFMIFRSFNLNAVIDVRTR
jgi:ABC-type thiamine transport system ATPase subunit